MGGQGPPETIEDAAITVDRAAELMADLGFVAFRSQSTDAIPDSSLVAIIRDSPTRRHFDPEVVTYWAMSAGRGQLDAIDRDTALPIARRYNWGRIRLTDRFHAKNGFASFGGELMADRIGPDARIVIFCSPAPIVRLRGHSQLQDRLADEIQSFFARVTPRLWTSRSEEAMVASAAPDALYSAFLIDAHNRLSSASSDDEEQVDIYRNVVRELDLFRRHRPAAVETGARLIRRLGLSEPGRPIDWAEESRPTAHVPRWLSAKD